MNWRSVVITTLVLAVGSTADAQDNAPLLDSGRRDLLHEALSGEMAKEHVIAITRHHRIQGSRGYRDAGQYVLDQLRAYGYGEDEAWIESYPSDGKIVYQTWQSPSGWDIDWAELRMVEPYEERIVGFPEVAMSLITYSNPGDATAELVWVGAGTRDSDYEGLDVAGKFVLATGYGGSVHRLAVVKYGAAAVVCYLDDYRAKEYPDMLQYTGMWPLAEELEHVTFGFNITNRQGERLRQMLESGRVVLNGSARGIGLESYYMDVVVARIEGSERPDEELVIVTHLDHPKESANDNASGSGATLDIAATLKTLIDEGRMERPKRSLRFLWVPEWNGTMAYIDGHPELVGPELGGSYLASMNLDMVGENLELLHSRMYITRNPASLPSALDDVVENMAGMVDGMNVRTPRGSLSDFNYRITPYSGGSDHMMLIDRKIPSMMIGHSDYTHHTSEDTPDKVDPVELERSEIIATAALLYLSDLSEAEALDLVYLVGANSAARLGTAARRARRGLVASDRPGYTDFFEARSTVTHAGTQERAAVSSVLSFHHSERVSAAVEAVNERLYAQEVAMVAALRGEIELPSRGVAPAERTEEEDRRVPVRSTRGPLDFGLPASELSAEDAAWYSTAEFTLGGSARFELVNFIDGERTVTQIRDALAAEFGPVSIAEVARYLDDLATVGAIEWK
jgi:hypothetical protein